MMAEKMNYKELSSLLDRAAKEIELGRIECQKAVPDEVVICDHIIENLGSLLDQISSCIFPNYNSPVQSSSSLSRGNVDIADNTINSCFEN